MSGQDWSFERLTDFDAHVREQLPWYELVTGAVALIARSYIPKGGLVYDLGASTGNVGRAIAATLEERGASLIAIECAPNLAQAYDAPGQMALADVLTFDYQRFDVAILFLTLMFLPVAERGALLARLRALLRAGGAIIVVDKCLAPSGYAAIINARLTWLGKVNAGVSGEDIVAKEFMLAGVQRPIAVKELGKDAVEVFRFGDFAGWILEN